MENDLRKALGLKIKLLRSRQNLSQLKLAMICGLNNTYLADVENGKRNASLDIIGKIAKGLNVSLSELFSGITDAEDKSKLLVIVEINSILNKCSIEILRLIKTILESIMSWTKESTFLK